MVDCYRVVDVIIVENFCLISFNSYLFLGSMNRYIYHFFFFSAPHRKSEF